MPKNANHYCLAIGPEDLSAEDKKNNQGQKAAVLLGSKWNPGDVITVTFMGGSAALRKRVQDVATQWTKPGIARLTLNFKTSGSSNIRVAFQQGNGSWSYIGTVCKSIPSSRPTMNFGWLTDASSDAEVRRVVLHEFGHAIGLIHEHQNPIHAIKWNKPAVIADLSGPPNNWDPQTIDNNMFSHYTQKQVKGTNVDPKSIMMYPIPASWTLDGFSTGMNGTLSPLDKQLVHQVYS